jgi:hypothetical protein
VHPATFVALLLASSTSTATDSPEQSAPVQQLVPVVEPGKPMRFEVVQPAPQPAAQEVPPDACALEGLVDRRTTPSRGCTVCHDGSRASDARTGHKFDVDYARARVEPTNAGAFRAEPEQFNGAIVLVGGTVVCTTCHSSTSTLASRLVAPVNGPEKGRLCVACHLR